MVSLENMHYFRLNQVRIEPGNYRENLGESGKNWASSQKTKILSKDNQVFLGSGII